MKVRALLLFFLICISARSQDVLICTGKTAYAYHSGRCRGLNQCEGQIVKIDLSEVKKNHRSKPCAYCYGGVSSASSSTQGSSSNSSSVQRLIAPSNASSSNTSGQCSAVTKKGNRCKRSVSSGRYCWQHG